MLHWNVRGHDRLAAYLSALERQMELMEGMHLSLRRIAPNNTHREFLKFLGGPMTRVIQACINVSDGLTASVHMGLNLCHCHKHDPPGGPDLQGLVFEAHRELDNMLDEFVKARLAILYGMKPVAEGDGPIFRRPSLEMSMSKTGSRPTSLEVAVPPPPEGENHPFGKHTQPSFILHLNQQAELNVIVRILRHDGSVVTVSLCLLVEGAEVGVELVKRQRSGDIAFFMFLQEYEKLGYANILPRNAFLLDLSLYIKSFSRMLDICTAPADPVARPTLPHLISYIRSSVEGLLEWRPVCPSRRALWAMLRQPVKVALAVIISSITVLSVHVNETLGPVSLSDRIMLR